MNLKFHNNKNGFGLVEALVSIGIMATLSAGIYLGIEYWFKELDTCKADLTLNDIHIELVDSLSTRAQFLQVDYSSESAESILGGGLPMAWNSKGDQIPVKDCNPNCPSGRYGMVVKPLTGSKGLYTMTVKVIHKSWKEPKIISLLAGE
ncbi:MAG: prepilin-type N-terminal cleavage/methylation domain-containing protein [Bacteriovoracaceae bacterium]|nr:prepilin-type N-terminal cleavage/methylation domain-containing protein [Bacteriovoracaceae bacterium]